MTTNEQITALLHGELADDKSVAELMHRLSVSPEKRAAFLEQIQLSRSLLRSGGSFAPAPAAAQGVLDAIAAMEASDGGSMAAAGASTDAPSPVTDEPRRRRLGLLLLLLLGALGGGYILGSTIATVGTEDTDGIAAASAEHRTESAPPDSERSLASRNPQKNDASSQSANEPSGSKGLNARPNAGGPNAEMDRTISPQERATGTSTSSADMSIRRGTAATPADLTAELRAARAAHDDLFSQLQHERAVTAQLRERVRQLDEQIAAYTSGAEPETSNSVAPIETPSARTRALTPAAPVTEHSAAQQSPLADPDGASVASGRLADLPNISAADEPGLWRLEMRQFFRSSLPTVEGLSPSGDILTDREFGASIGFNALSTAVRFGVGIGKTEFAQVFHTNTGGALNDTIIEQSPRLVYGRAYVAPTIFEGESFSSALEFGVGGMEMGPIGSVGLNLEYAFTDRVRLQGGLSTWMLWTSFRNQMHTSTNLNAHVGLSITP